VPCRISKIAHETNLGLVSLASVLYPPICQINRAVSAYTGSHHQVLVVVKAHLEKKLLHEFLLLLLTLVALGKAYTLANSKTAWQ